MSEPTTTTQTHLTWRERERAPAPLPQGTSSLRVPAALCAIFLGALGVHKFLLGYRKQGVITLLVTVLTLGFGGILMALIGVIEGAVYLATSDGEFARTYVAGRRGWF